MRKVSCLQRCCSAGSGTIGAYNSGLFLLPFANLEHCRKRSTEGQNLGLSNGEKRIGL